MKGTLAKWVVSSVYKQQSPFLQKAPLADHTQRSSLQFPLEYVSSADTLATGGRNAPEADAAVGHPYLCAVLQRYISRYVEVYDIAVYHDIQRYHRLLHIAIYIAATLPVCEQVVQCVEDLNLHDKQ